MAAEQVSRAAVLAYRAWVHDLERPAPDPAQCGVLDVGVQDNPAGGTAGQALRVRSASPDGTEPTSIQGLVLVYSLRGAMHVHRERDLGLLTAALRPDEAEDADAVDRVADAMTQAIDEVQAPTKGQLSTHLTPLVPPRLRAWCPGCQARHVPDGLFRAATLQAGLRLEPVGNRTATFERSPALDRGDVEPARRELLRRFLHRSGPTAAADLAAWTGTTPPVAKRWWRLLADQLVEVRIDDQRLWMHREDLAAARESDASTAVRLLPPYDPLAEVANRQLLLPDPMHRRQVWRAVANPGLVLLTGEIAGTWRHRQHAIIIAPFRSLSTAQQRAVRDAATSNGTTPTLPDIRFSQ